MEHLPDTTRRLLGMHAMSATNGSRKIGISPQALSELQARKREPSLATVQKLARFFELPMDRLLDVPFRELLETDLADADRFDRVEAKIRGGPATLSSARGG